MRRMYCILLFPFILITSILFFQTPASALDRYWLCGSGEWNDNVCWTVPGSVQQPGQPEDGDNAFIMPDDAINRTVTYANSLYPTAVLSQLQIGNWQTGISILSQAQDTLSVIDQYVGYIGTGVFSLSGGTNSVTTLMISYTDGDGTYNLSGTGTLSANIIALGFGGSGTFNHSAGSNTVNTLYVGYSSAAYNLSGTGNLSVTDEIIGFSGSGTFSQYGGVHTVSNNISFGDETGGGGGEYTIEGGILTVSGNIQSVGPLSNATLNIKGGSVTANWISVNGLTIDGGTVSAPTIGAYNLLIASAPGTSYTHTLSGTDVMGFTDAYIGVFGSGTFNQTGGTHTTDNIYLGYYAAGSGVYTLSGGSLNVSGNITGGAGNAILSIDGGSLSASAIKDVAIINFSDGTVTADITITGTMTITGTGTPVIDGSVVNNGIVKVTDTTAEFTGPFINNSVYDSDPSTSVFKDLTVNSSGYITAGSGDIFSIKNDFINQSAQNVLWDTSDAALSFVSGTDTTHDMHVPGYDYGAVIEGYTDNFAWGTLSLAAGNTLNLSDAGPLQGGALYVDILNLPGGTGQISDINTSGLINIYYKAWLPENGYLIGETYMLTGGGKLIPVNLPQYELTTSVSPSGNGSINPDCSGGCQYDSGTVVILNAIANSGYPFISWTGCDSSFGNNNCNMTMDGDKTLIGTFDSCMYPARVFSGKRATSYFTFLQDALSGAVADDTVESRDYTFTESIQMDNPTDIIIKAGYDCTYSSASGITSISGNLIVNDGSITVESGTLRLQ